MQMVRLDSTVGIWRVYRSITCDSDCKEQGVCLKFVHTGIALTGQMLPLTFIWALCNACVRMCEENTRSSSDLAIASFTMTMPLHI